MKRLLPNQWLALRLLLLFGFVASALWASMANGSVNDEYAAHVTSGYLYWSSGRFAGGVHNPPLGQLWVALPYYLSNLPLYPFTDDAPVLSRLANVLLAAGAILLIGEWLRKRAGEAAACFGTMTLVATPEFLAHASLATIDLPVAVAFCAATLAALSYVRSLRLSSAAWTSFWWGIALCVKITSLLFLPVLLSMFLVTFFTVRGKHRAHLFRLRFPAVAKFVLHAVFFVGVVCVMIWASYGFRRFQGRADGHRGTVWFLPQEFVDQLRGKAAYASEGNLAYFSGMVRPGGWWWYYYVILLLKTPLPLFLLWILALGHAFAKGTSRSRALAAAIVTFLVCAGFNRAQIGVRHLLPLMPLFAVLGGLTMTRCSRRVAAAAWGLAGASFFNAVLFLPFPLTAESLLLAGHGYRVFADSNYDWGQANGALRQEIKAGRLIRPLPYEITTGTIAVRVNEWAGFRACTREGYAWLRREKPVARLKGAVLVFDVNEDNLPLSNLADTPAIVLSRELRRAVRENECLCSPCLSLLDRLEPFMQNDALPKVLQILELQCPRFMVYQMARRLALLVPHVSKAKQFVQRQALLLEAETSEASNPAKAAFARANALWLEGDLHRALQETRQALLKGAPEEACAHLIYKISCAMGYWRNALEWGAKLPLSAQASLDPPIELMARFARGSASADEWFQLGVYWFRQELWLPAAHCFIAALEHDPTHASAMNMLGELIVRYKEETLSLSDLRRCELERLSLDRKKSD